MKLNKLNIKKLSTAFYQKTKGMAGPPRFPAAHLRALDTCTRGILVKETLTQVPAGIAHCDSIYPRPHDVKYQQTVIRSTKVLIDKKWHQELKKWVGKKVWLYPKGVVCDSSGNATVYAYGISVSEITPEHFDELVERQKRKILRKSFIPDDPALKTGLLEYLQKTQQAGIKLAV